MLLLQFSHPKTWNDPFEYDKKLDTKKGRLYACFAQNKSDVGEQDALDNILMWSHYADSHKGICIEYEHNVDEPNGYTIRYEQKRDMGSKQECWEYENEFRIPEYGSQDVDFSGVDIPYRAVSSFPLDVIDVIHRSFFIQGLPMPKFFDLKIKAIYCGVKFEKTQLETLKIISIGRNFEIFTGKVENYASIKFTKTGAVERT